MKIFHGDFKSEADIAWEFNVHPEEVKMYHVEFAMYEEFGCGGKAFILLKKDRKFYIVDATHCSCEGLEEQWSLEEVSLGVLRKIKFLDYDDNPEEELLEAFNKVLDRLGVKKDK